MPVEERVRFFPSSTTNLRGRGMVGIVWREFALAGFSIKLGSGKARRATEKKLVPNRVFEEGFCY
jgi:hypothetical protein